MTGMDRIKRYKVYFEMTPELYNKLDAEAKAYFCSKSSIVRRALTQYYNKEE